MARQPYLPTYRQALPVMGRDGTLTNVQVDSPAAGHVHAKTGGVVPAMGPDGPATTYRALAGYIDLPDGRLTAFGAFTEQDVTRDEAGGLQDLARETLGEIATAVYEEASS
jgi:D-alanyl-D-alanine carboxypeptidase/D-alanyl-D-alanine-endopeptidase (penicillin-binding protein 4)